MTLETNPAAGGPPAGAAGALPLRADLVGCEPYGAPQLDVPHLLNVNENPYAPPAVVVAEAAAGVAEAVAHANRYPDREFLDLRADLAAYLVRESGGQGLTARNIWAANGSNEVMHHVFQAFGGPGRTALSFAPTYSMYPDYARDTFTAIEFVERTPAPAFAIDLAAALPVIESQRPTIVIVTSPNNPTGTSVDLETIRELARAQQVHGGVIVVDEAYGEFRREGTASAVTLLPEFGHMAVLRTMSKAFAYAGSRLGYLASAPELVDALRIVRLPYHLSSSTQAIARAALRHSDVLLAQVNSLRAERDVLEEWLRQRGYAVAASDANFVYFGTFEDRQAVWQGLLDRGVLIRATGPAGWLRVSVGTPDDMTAFKNALTEVDPR
ncbi:histidinol-phosphate transaminase [Micrococcales bacterium 31B]|nr:histidinol-phosphate transaminase [Micrococcales bacterium 31B]